MTLQITLTSSYNIIGSFNLRQKVFICICTHSDINKIYKNELLLYTTIQRLLWILINKTEWVNEWLTKSPNSTEFSVLVLINFLVKKDILGLAMLI